MIRKPIVFCILITLNAVNSCSPPSQSSVVNTEPEPASIPPAPVYGLPGDSFKIIRNKIKKNQFLSEILLEYRVPYALIHKISERSKNVFDVRKFRRGNPYAIFCLKNSPDSACCFVYEINDVDYVTYDFRTDSLRIGMGHKKVTLVDREAEGEITYSLYESLQSAKQNIMLAFEMAEIYAWTIDFYRLQPGDRYRVIYLEKMVGNKSIGIDRIQAVIFNHEGKNYFGYYFEQNGKGDYFDQETQNLRKAFLKSPLKFSRLTSGFSRRRFHPVQKRWKAHLGTDYAAPRGTPILCTGDGKVIESGHKTFNGNFVKIRHNGTYTTQYLHMSKIRSGIKAGVAVSQGEVIGFVGSTGLATGPHVCYRFWKNGNQVNHLREEFPPAEPVEKKHLGEFQDIVKKMNEKLDVRTFSAN